MKRNSRQKQKMSRNVDCHKVTPSYFRALSVAVRAAMLVRRNKKEASNPEDLRPPLGKTSNENSTGSPKRADG
jgi:hypothetical protein